MNNLRGKAAAIVGVAALALLGLLVLAIVQGSYDTLLVGVIAFVGVLFAARSGTAGVRKSADSAGLAQVAAGVARLEDTVASSPKMLDGSSERQIAETAARFDWLARRHNDEAERLDAFMRELETTVARQHEEVLAHLESRQLRVDTARAAESDGDSGTTGLGR